MKKKILSLCLVVAMVATAVVGASMAFLTDEDSDVNVMTLGNVDIEQIEYQRETNEDGSYKTGTIDEQNSYVLEAFEQNKPLLPFVGNYASGGWDGTPVRMTQVGSHGGMNVLIGENAVDKFVTVKNTGNTDAYVRTLVAIEYGKGNPALIGRSYHFTWKENMVGEIEIDGNNYYLYEYVYLGGAQQGGVHDNGILPAGDTSYPSLAQVYLKSEATNEDCAALDGNGNGTLDILVLSQAVQAAGFEDAVTALNAGFGEANAENAATWFGGTVIPSYVSTMTDLEAALANGGEVNLTADIAIPEGEQILVPAGSTATLNLNGYTITSTSKSYGIRNEGNVTITNGTIEGQFGAIGNYGDAVCVVENATLISKGYPGNSSHAIYTSGNSSLTLTNVTVNHEGAGADGSVLYAAGSSTVVINSGNFTWSGSAYTLAAAGTSNVTINGGTFQNDNFFNWGGTITDNR